MGSCMSIPIVVIGGCAYLIKICPPTIGVPLSQLSLGVVMKVLLCAFAGLSLVVIGLLSLYVLWSSLKYLIEEKE